MIARLLFHLDVGRSKEIVTCERKKDAVAPAEKSHRLEDLQISSQGAGVLRFTQ